MPKATQREKAVVLLSGGMDSCVCATLAVRDCEAAALHVSYGQRTEARELHSFHGICDKLGIRERLVFRNALFAQIGGSALTDSGIAVPDAPLGNETIGMHIPVTYVPFRNANLLSAAVSWAETIHAQKIYIGAVEQDSSGYPDCRPAFYDAFNRVIEAGTKAGSEGDLITVVTPLIAMRKSEIIQLGIKLKAPLELTWSCYRGEDNACGTCESCVLRLQAFDTAGAKDPITYVISKTGK
jgi:7-cyano-7-deazaguanine synthase